jgi:RecA-family ATPase
MIPKEMTSKPYWVLWKAETTADGKPTKVPYQVNGAHAKVNEPSTWTTYEQVTCANAQGKFSGIGFMLVDGWIFADFDGCIKDGVVSPEVLHAIEICDSYTEVSPNEHGIHIYVEGDLPGGTVKVAGYGELYNSSRYFTVTGNSFGEPKPVRKLSPETVAELKEIYTSRRPAKPSPAPGSDDKTKGDTQPTPPKGDLTKLKSDILKAMLRSSVSAKIRKLLEGDLSGHNGDHSLADIAYCGHLAFWTNKDSRLMDAMFRDSKLMREKWDVVHFKNGETYGEHTIGEAISKCDRTIGNKLMPDLETVSGEIPDEPLPPWTWEELSVTRFRDPPPPQEYIIDGFLPIGVVGVASGEGGATNKSMSAISLGIQMASADVMPQKWLGHWGLKKQRMLYVSLEDSSDDVWRRIHAIINAMYAEKDRRKIWDAVGENFGVLGKEKFHAFGLYEKMIDEHGDATEKYNRFLDTIQKIKPDLIVIDTKTKAAGVDENDNQLNSRMMDHMARLCESENKPSVLLISHVSKSVRSGKDSYAGNATRGAGAIGDDSRFTLWFRVESSDDSLIEIINTKNSYGKKAQPIVVEFDFPLFKLTKHTAGTIKEERAQRADREIKDKIKSILVKSPRCKTAIAVTIGKQKSTVLRCINEMIDDRIIVNVGTGNKQQCMLRGATSDEAVA